MSHSKDLNLCLYHFTVLHSATGPSDWLFLRTQLSVLFSRHYLSFSTVNPVVHGLVRFLSHHSPRTSKPSITNCFLTADSSVQEQHTQSLSQSTRRQSELPVCPSSSSKAGLAGESEIGSQKRHCGHGPRHSVCNSQQVRFSKTPDLLSLSSEQSPWHKLLTNCWL